MWEELGELRSREASGGAEVAKVVREAVAYLESMLTPPARRPPSLLDPAEGFLGGLFKRRR